MLIKSGVRSVSGFPGVSVEGSKAIHVESGGRSAPGELESECFVGLQMEFMKMERMIDAKSRQWGIDPTVTIPSGG